MPRVRAGILGKVKLDMLDADEASVVRSLGKVWWITWVKPAVFKSSRYVFALAKPTDELRQMFNLDSDRAVLVLLHPYHEFQTRVFDFVDKLMSDFPNRLDRLVVVLVSKDPAIASKVRAYVAEYPEARIIVPLCYGEVSLVDSTAIQLRRLRESLFARNLFSFTSPLRSDVYFFGRAELLGTLYDKYHSGENCGVFGLRKTGKTSLLYALHRRLSLRGEKYIHVDCHNPGFYQKSWWEALRAIIEFGADGEVFEPGTEPLTETYDAKSAPDMFLRDLRKLNRRRKSRVLITLDEIESISPGLSPAAQWSSGNDSLMFWQAIRAVYQQSPELFAVVVAGVNPSCVEAPSMCGVDNPIYRFIIPRYLPLFTAEQVRDMVRSIGRYMGVSYDEEVFTYLAEDYGGHPFLIRLVCSLLYESAKASLPHRTTKFEYSNNKESVDRQLGNDINQILSVLRDKYPEEYEMLEYLATGQEEVFHELAGLSTTLVQHLEGYGLIKRHEGKYYFMVKAVKEYIQQRASVRPVRQSLEEKWAEVMSSRNELETNMRRMVRYALKSHFDEKSARSKLLEAISPPERRSKLSYVGLKDLLSETSSPLYFDELKKIVLHFWGVFGVIFSGDKDKFRTYMEFVNKHRVDAHAKDITNDDLGILMIAVKWLGERTTEYLA